MDIYYSYIIVDDKPKEAVFIRSANAIKDLILSLKIDDVLNLNKIGRLKIKKIIRNVYDDDFKSISDETENKYHEIGLVCEKVSDYWSVNTSTMVKYLIKEKLESSIRLQQILDDDYSRTWGDDGYEAKNVHEWFDWFDPYD